ncbi:MAG: amino acid adenylation domain-containing protein [Xanthobacteraceae bacterium]|nr:amino acid adenylation domain-containing protein [Xanthobacteraceae bacterium]
MNAPLNATAHALPCDQAASLFDLFHASRAAHATRPALWVDGRALTYAELYDATAHLAGAIQAARGADAQHGELQCGLLVCRSASAYTGVLATLMAGSTYVPLNPSFPSERLRDILAASAIDTVVVDGRSEDVAADVLQHYPRKLTVILPDAAGPQAWFARAPQHRYLTLGDIARAVPAAPPSLTPEQGAYLLFTSGSTGKPKGVLITHANVLAYVRGVTRRYRPGPQDRFSQLFDFSFDLSVHDMFVAWGAGACLYCAPEGSLAGTADFIRRCELTFWFSVPATAAFMRRMRMLKPGSFPTLRWSLFCGEALPMALARAWQDAASNSTVENLYGPTEATIAFTAYRLPKEPNVKLDAMQTVPIGTPLPGQKVMVVDESGRPVRDGEAGELCLGGSQVAGGYWRAGEQTAERFRAPSCDEAKGTRWYRTGDLAVVDREHGLIFRGRIDRQAKIRGYRVELQEVENAMRVAAGTDTVAAIPWPLGEGGLANGIAGFVAGSRESAVEIIERMREVLPAYMVPSEISALADWPLNANGKTDYKSLLALLQKAGA